MPSHLEHMQRAERLIAEAMLDVHRPLSVRVHAALEVIHAVYDGDPPSAGPLIRQLQGHVRGAT